MNAEVKPSSRCFPTNLWFLCTLSFPHSSLWFPCFTCFLAVVCTPSDRLMFWHISNVLDRMWKTCPCCMAALRLSARPMNWYQLLWRANRPSCDAWLGLTRHAVVDRPCSPDIAASATQFADITYISAKLLLYVCNHCEAPLFTGSQCKNRDTKIETVVF